MSCLWSQVWTLQQRPPLRDCLSRQRQGETPYSFYSSHNYEGGIFESLCVLSDTTPKYHTNKTIALDHHLYDHLSDTLIKKRSKPQPFINLIIKLLPEDHIALGFSLIVTLNTIKLQSMADTGCQSCLARIQVTHKLGLTSPALSIHANTKPYH